MDWFKLLSQRQDLESKADTHPNALLFFSAIQPKVFISLPERHSKESFSCCNCLIVSCPNLPLFESLR